MTTMNDSYKNHSTFVLLMAASLLSACSHTGQVHHENLYEMIPAASDRMNEELIEEANYTTLNGGPGGYR